MTRHAPALDTERQGLLRMATRDPRVRGLALKAYIEALFALDLEEMRPLKAHWVAYVIRARREHVIRAIRRLVDLGYLQRARGRRNRAWTYVLVARPPHPDVP